MPTEEQLRMMILDIICKADYDLAKSLDPELSEDPEETERTMRVMMKTAQMHVSAWKDGSK